MVKIRNLTNSPFDIQGHRVPAFGEIEADISGEYLALLEASAAVTITASTDELDEWRALYEAEHGEAPDGRWSAKRIQKELGIDPE